MSAAIAGDDCAALLAGGTCESMCAGRRMVPAFRVLYWSRRGRHLRRIRSPRFEDIAPRYAIEHDRGEAHTWMKPGETGFDEGLE